jgi:hypothetical protein
MEPDDSRRSHSDDPFQSEDTEVWVDYAAVDCDYDYWGESIWYLDADIGASYVYFEDEVEVGVYVDGWEYYPLYSVGYGMWTVTLETYYYDCNDANVFDFVVSDVYGNYDEVTIWW